MIIKAMYSQAYLAIFNEVLIEERIDFLQSPSHATNLWKEFIDELTDDYDFVHPEFGHDLQNIRPQIELLLRSNKLAAKDDHIIFVHEIALLDTRFKDLTMENPAWINLEKRYWFENRILKVAGPTYAKFINDHFEKDYGIKVITKTN